MNYLEKLEEDNRILKQMEIESEMKQRMRRKGYVPVLSDDIIHIYGVEVTDETYKIASQCSDELFDIYSIVTNDEKMKNDLYYRSSCTPRFRNFLSYHSSTKDEIWDYYDLDDDVKKEEFLKLPQNKAFKYDDMSFDDIVEAMSEYYFTYLFKTPSKLNKFILSMSDNMNLDFIASCVYSFLYSEYKEFSYGSNIVESEQIEIDRMSFSNKEKNMPFEDKISLINSVINSLKIECLHSFPINNMNDFIMSNVFGTKSKELILKFSEHNALILHNSDFSPIYEKVSSKTKILK